MHSRFIVLADLRECATEAAVVGIAENRVGIVVVFPMFARVFAFVLSGLSGHTSMVRGNNRSARGVAPTDSARAR